MQRFALFSGLFFGIISLPANAFCRGGPYICYMPPCPAGMACAAMNMGPMTGPGALGNTPVTASASSYFPSASLPSGASNNSSLDTMKMMSPISPSASSLKSKQTTISNGETGAVPNNLTEQ